ncbi:MAG: hypothetical protein ACTSU2_06000 [Promethearchaeota archaeon]
MVKLKYIEEINIIWLISAPKKGVVHITRTIYISKYSELFRAIDLFEKQLNQNRCKNKIADNFNFHLGLHDNIYNQSSFKKNISFFNHYYNEIIRFLNQLRFIYRKIIRNSPEIFGAFIFEDFDLKYGIIYYLIYRRVREHASYNRIRDEFNIIKADIKKQILSFKQSYRKSKRISKVKRSADLRDYKNKNGNKNGDRNRNRIEVNAAIKVLNEFNSTLYRFHEIFMQFIKKLVKFKIEKIIKNKTDIERISILEGVPTFFIRNLKNYLSLDEIVANVRYMNEQHKEGRIYFRFNLDLVSDTLEKQILKDLRENDILYARDIDLQIPHLYYVNAKFKEKLVSTPYFKAKQIFIQDKISILIVYLLAPKKGELILDMSSAPGMKTELINELTRNEADIIAFEYNYGRIIEMQKNLNLNLNLNLNHKYQMELIKKDANSKKPGHHHPMKRIFLVNCDSVNPPIRHEVRFDKILIDAPCTGSGNFGQAPELKWRQSYKFLRRNVQIQRMLINSALVLLKNNNNNSENKNPDNNNNNNDNENNPGGNLKSFIIYSVCSMYAEEGELLLKSIIKSQETREEGNSDSNTYIQVVNPLELDEVPLKDQFFIRNPEDYTDPYKQNIKCLRFLPRRSKSKGFFVTKIRKS